MNNRFYQIGQLAGLAGITVETLRFYETQGLIKAKTRSASGYRLYAKTDAQRLYFIVHAKNVGFSLKEISLLLDLQLNKDQHTCEEVKSHTHDKIAEVNQKIGDLEKIRHALEKLHQACCGGNESASHCSILNALEDPDYFRNTGVN